MWWTKAAFTTPSPGELRGGHSEAPHCERVTIPGWGSAAFAAGVPGTIAATPSATRRRPDFRRSPAVEEPFTFT